MNSLRAFEASARLLSFKLAGEELSLTASAISRKIQNLEDYLGVALFERQNRGLELNEFGQQYVAQVGKLLCELAEATESIRSKSSSARIRLSFPPYYSPHWISNTLEAFHQDHPHIEVEFDSNAEIIDFEHSDVDAAIWLGTGNWFGLKAHRLMTLRLTPACSPKLLGGRGGKLRHFSDLSDYPWLHTSVLPNGWSDWLVRVGEVGLKSKRNLFFDKAMLGYQAARDGQGFIIVGKPLADASVEAGDLICPFEDDTVVSEKTFYLVYPDDDELRPSLRTFRDWLLNYLAVA